MTTTMYRNEEETHRTKRKDDEEIRLIRANEDNKQTITGPLRRGDVTCCHHDLYRRFSSYRNIPT